MQAARGDSDSVRYRSGVNPVDGVSVLDKSAGSELDQSTVRNEAAATDLGVL
jgi:hypothetical protein